MQLLSRIHPSLLALSTLAFSATLPSQAQALQGQIFGGLQLATAQEAAPTVAGWWGPGVHAGATMNLSESWRLTADVGGSYHFARQVEDDERIGPHGVVSIAAGARYAFDVFTYVPYAGLSAVFHPMAPPNATQQAGDPFSLRATIGMDYRASRSRSWGIALDLGAPLLAPDRFPHYSGIRIYGAYHFRRF